MTVWSYMCTFPHIEATEEHVTCSPNIYFCNEEIVFVLSHVFFFFMYYSSFIC